MVQWEVMFGAVISKIGNLQETNSNGIEFKNPNNGASGRACTRLW